MQRQGEFAPPPKAEKPKKPWEGGGDRRDMRPAERRPEQSPRPDVQRRDDMPRARQESRPSFSPPRTEERSERPSFAPPRPEQRPPQHVSQGGPADPARSSLKAAIAAVRSDNAAGARSPLEVLREKRTSRPPEPAQKSAASSAAPAPRMQQKSAQEASNPHENAEASVRTDIPRDNAAHDGVSEDMLRRLLRDDR